MKSLNKISFISTCVYLALSSGNQAFAACDNYLPGSGQAVQCDTSPPNPTSTAITSANGVSNVSVNINSGSVLNINDSAAVSLGGGSQITHAGQLTGTRGILLREGSSEVNNSGSIIGTAGPGVEFSGNGNNQLTNSGTIRGVTGGNAVTFGAGDDTLIVAGGTITGSVDQGNGADKAVISNGTLTDTLSQGSGIDDFVMSGGTLGALEQGDNRDTFTMTGGTIVNAFEDGDVATMTGGKIGRVNMKLDNNIFAMSGGEIVGNLVTGFGNDITTVSGNSVIGGNISVSGGVDSVTVTGGTVKGEIRMSSGNDTFHWEKGSILGSVLMEADNDRIEFTDLDATTAATSPLIDGGSGNDTLIMNNSQYIYSAANLLHGIERINLNNASTLTLNNRALPLGDAEDDNNNTGYSIDSSSTLAIQNGAATTFKSHLSGSGTLSANLGGNAFSFDSNNAGDNFAGTLALGNATLDLSGLNTQALGLATLKVGAGSVTTVGAGEQRIGSLTFDGGTIDFGSVAPGNTLAENSIQTVNSLNLAGSGTVQVGLNNALNATPVAINTIPLLAQDDASTTIRLAGSNGAVSGNAGGLTLIDRAGNVITDSVTDAIEQNAVIVAQGTWDWRLTTGESQDGLYIGYALKQLDLQGSGDSALALNGGGASGNAADLNAKITGSGDLAIENPAGGAVSLSNQTNDYTGITDLRSGSLLMNNNNVLGNTALLQLATDTALKMQGFTQTVGQVNSAENSQIDLGGGGLTVDRGGAVNGHLLGSGELTLNEGILDINGDNASLTANTRILDGATINLTSATGLGSGAINNAGRLNLNAANGQLQNSLSNGGEVNLHTSQTVLTGDNGLFSGTFNIDPASQLTASEAQHLGDAVVNDSGTLMLITDTNWMLNNSVIGEGQLIKQGAGTLTLTQASGGYTGATSIDQGGINFGSRDLPLTLASSVVNINQGFLAANGTVAGDVNNASLLQVGNSFPPQDAALTHDALTVGGNLTNGGQIQLAQTGSSAQAGNLLTVNGDYLGNGGSIVFNTVLGDDSSATDLMSVKGDTGGTTRVSVENVGGSGARTLNGIELINVAGNSAGNFLQSGRIVAGAYDYRLARGASGNQRNWYLTNSASAPIGSVSTLEPTPPTDPTTPVSPTPPTTPTPPGNPTNSATAASANEVMLRPEAGSYIENLAAANSMFTTRLHDRLGETQYTDALSGENQVTSLWLRQVGTRNGWRSNIGALKTTSNQYVAMLGGDVAQWSHDGLDRGHIGLMGGYGDNQSHTRSAVTGNASKGEVRGYNVGVYGTWYANDAAKTGLYLDSWLQYGWFKNKVNGEGLPEEKYNANGLSASFESGYTWKIGEFNGSRQSSNQVYIQPQAQVIWMGVKANNHTESNGTQINSEGNGNIQTRLGTRLFTKGHSNIDDGKHREFEPFIEVNWLHNTRNFSTDMNGVSISQNGAKNIGEVRTGVEGQLTKNLTAWGNIGQQLGDQGYSNTEAMLGIKYAW